MNAVSPALISISQGLSQGLLGLERRDLNLAGVPQTLTRRSEPAPWGYGTEVETLVKSPTMKATR